MSDAIKIIGVTVGTPQNPEKITKGYVPESRKIAGLELSGDITGEELRDALEIVTEQIFDPESNNAQSGVAVAEAINGVISYHNKVIKDFTTLFDVATRKLSSSTQCKITFILTATLSDTKSGTALPNGRYLCVNSSHYSNKIICFDLYNHKEFTVESKHVYENGNIVSTYYEVIESAVSILELEQRVSDTEGALQEIGAKFGDIDTALDELHAYAQSLISGGATE